MDGKNSSGRRVSLLNDGPEAPTLVRLPSITPSLRSRTSSYTSSPIGSPAIPRLVRSDSSDSVTMQTPSPITPEFAPFDGQMPGMTSPYNAQQQYFDMPHNGMPHNGLSHNDMKSENFEYQQPHILGPVFNQQTYYRPQMSEQHVAAPPPAPVNARPKKNSYPCPMAKQYGCSDYFTTSGHAARHAKKHTGRKDAFCPECNKAFTRKDNMEQHRRTHQTGRNAKNGSDTGVKKTKPAPKRPRPSPIQSSAPVPTPDMYDPALSMSPDSTAAFMAPAVQHADLSPRQPMYPDPTHYSMSHGYSIGSSSGLDVLAVAASGEKRKFE